MLQTFTNGTSLTPDKLEFPCRHGVHVTISRTERRASTTSTGIVGGGERRRRRGGE